MRNMAGGKRSLWFSLAIALVAVCFGAGAVSAQLPAHEARAVPAPVCRANAAAGGRKLCDYVLAGKGSAEVGSRNGVYALILVDGKPRLSQKGQGIWTRWDGQFYQARPKGCTAFNPLFQLNGDITFLCKGKGYAKWIVTAIKGGARPAKIAITNAGVVTFLSSKGAVLLTIRPGGKALPAAGYRFTRINQKVTTTKKPNPTPTPFGKPFYYVKQGAGMAVDYYSGGCTMVPGGGDQFQRMCLRSLSGDCSKVFLRYSNGMCLRLQKSTNTLTLDACPDPNNDFTGPWRNRLERRQPSADNTPFLFATGGTGTVKIQSAANNLCLLNPLDTNSGQVAIGPCNLARANFGARADPPPGTTCRAPAAVGVAAPSDSCTDCISGCLVNGVCSSIDACDSLIGNCEQWNVGGPKGIGESCLESSCFYCTSGCCGPDNTCVDSSVCYGPTSQPICPCGQDIPTTPAPPPRPPPPPPPPPPGGGEVATITPDPGSNLAIAFNRLNDVRAQSGLAPVQLGAGVTKGADNHATYLFLNQGNPAVEGLGAHNEDPSLPGSTPEGRGDTDDSKYNNEVISFGAPAVAVDNLFNSVFHRIPLMHPGLKIVGIGVQGAQVVIRTTPAPNVADGYTNSSPVLFPGNGATGVKFNFQGEIPDPIPSGFPQPVGSPVSLHAFGQATLKDVTASLVGPKGAIDSWVFTPDAPPPGSNTPGMYGPAIFIIPKNPLSMGTDYTASISTTINGASPPQSFTWKFRTWDPPEVDGNNIADMQAHNGIYQYLSSPPIIWAQPPAGDFDSVLLIAPWSDGHGFTISLKGEQFQAVKAKFGLTDPDSFFGKFVGKRIRALGHMIIPQFTPTASFTVINGDTLTIL